MNEPPPLPSTSDPFELLGVSREASLSELKKAYARSIKLYRPDSAPVEFRRLHDAFELCRTSLSHRSGGDQTVVALESAPEERSSTAELHSGNADARSSTAEQPLAPPTQSIPGVVSALYAEAAPDRACNLLIDGLQQGELTVGEVLELSRAEVLPYLASHPFLHWQKLGALDLEYRGLLWALHAEWAIDAGHWRELVDELRLQSFGQAVKSDPSLREAAWLPLTVAAWDHPEEFFSAFDWLEVDARSDGCRSFLQACQARPLLAKVARSRATPDVFTELIRLGRAGPSVRRRLLTSLARSFFMNVQDWCGLCKRLSRARRPLASHLLETLALSGITEAVSAPATEWLEESEYFGARVSKLLQYLLRGAGALATYSIADWAFKSGGPDSHISGSQVWEVLLIVVALLLLQSWWDARRRVDPQSRELFSKLWAFAEASRSAGGHR